jgi:hypothetical protein
MSTITPPPDRAARHQAVLNDLIELGQDLAHLIVDSAKTGAIKPVDASKAFDRVTRSVRRSIFLARKLDEPLRAATDRTAARKRIIREVEDAIQRDTEGADSAALNRELQERLDAPDWDEDLLDHPVEDLIRDTLRDFGLAHIPGTHPWKRRTPADIAALNAQAKGVERTTVLSQGSSRGGVAQGSGGLSGHWNGHGGQRPLAFPLRE